MLRLTRQQAAIDESMPSPGRRGSQPTLSPDPDDGGILIVVVVVVNSVVASIYMPFAKIFK